MTLKSQLTAMLDDLGARLPQMVEENPDPGDFWPAFAGEADVIEDQAGEHCHMVAERLEAMWAEHGRYMAFSDMADDDG